MEIAQTINDHHTNVFIQLLAKAYQDYDRRPALCRLACVLFENAKYLVATDGIIAVALPTSPELELGDYEGVPHLVKLDDDRLCRQVNGLLKQLPGFKTAQLGVDENVYGTHAFVDESFFESETLTDDVLLVHVANDEFVIDMEKPYTHILKRDLYEYATNAIGYFDAVRYAKPDQMMGFFNNAGRGFALIMPMKPNCKIKKVAGF